MSRAGPGAGPGPVPAAPLSDICDELIVRMGADLSNAPRARVAVVFHQVGPARARSDQAPRTGTDARWPAERRSGSSELELACA